MRCSSLTPEWHSTFTRVAGRGTSEFAVQYRCGYRVDRAGTLFENGDAIATFADAGAAEEWLVARVESTVCEPALLSGWSRFRGALVTHESSPTTGVVMVGPHSGEAARSLLGRQWRIEGRGLLLHRDGIAIGVEPEATGRAVRVGSIVSIQTSRSAELVEGSALSLIEPLAAASERFAESESELVRRLIGLSRPTRGWVVRSPSAQTAASLVARLGPDLADVRTGL